MMPELNFSELRSDVESTTFLPEFQEVQRRSRKVRRRLRIRTVAAALAVTVPAVGALAAVYRHPQDTSTIAVTGRDGVVHLTYPTSKTQPDTWTLVAVDGLDTGHLFGLIDVCSGGNCSLEASSIDPDSVTGKVQTLSLFRTVPTDLLTNPRLVAVGPNTVVASAQINAGPERTQTLKLTPTSPVANASTSGHPVQPARAGVIEVTDAGGGVSAAPHQPQLSGPALLSTTDGWWVSGTDPLTGQLALALSTDSGRSWVNRPLSIDQVQAPPALGVLGNTAYLLVAAGGHLLLRKSTDRGLTWSTLTAPNTWKPASQYGVIVRPDRSVLVWLNTSSGTTLLHSKDGGLTFAPDRGSGSDPGPIVSLSDGYVMLGAKPALSHDAQTWTALLPPWQPQN